MYLFEDHCNINNRSSVQHWKPKQGSSNWLEKEQVVMTTSTIGEDQT